MERKGKRDTIANHFSASGHEGGEDETGAIAEGHGDTRHHNCLIGKRVRKKERKKREKGKEREKDKEKEKDKGNEKREQGAGEGKRKERKARKRKIKEMQ